MSAVTVSSKYQIVIPSDIRKALRIRPGQKLQMIAIGDQIRLVPERPIAEMRGFLKGVLNDFDRDADEEGRG